jgi:hypothetical protein
MGSNDKLKTAKIAIQAEDQAMDGHQDSKVKKPQKKERQKGKKVIKEYLTESEDMKFLKEFVEKYKKYDK